MKLIVKTGIAVILGAGLIAGYSFYHAEENREAKEERLEQDGMELAKRQEFLMQRDLSLNEIPTGRLELARRQREDMIAAGRTASVPWQERGPSNVGGRTRAILIDRSDATGNTVFAASVSGGIFKTTNFLTGTVSWTPVAERMANLAVTALWQDRTTATTFYAATGEGWFNVDGVKGAGVFRSTDGGATWAQLASTVAFEYCQDFVQDNNGNLYVSLRNVSSANRGIMRSSDNGVSWTQVAGLPLTSLDYRTGRAADLEVASNGDLYASLGIFTPGMIIKSPASAGAAQGTEGTWIDITPPFSDATNRCDIAVAPSNPLRVYVVGQDSVSSQVLEVLRSDNGGQTWASLPNPTGINNGAVSQNWYNLVIAVDPNNPDIVSAAGANVCRSTNGGSTWTTISSGVHVDHHQLVYASSTRLINGNDGGIFVTNNANATTPTWSNKNNSYNVTQFYGADGHPTAPDYFLAGAQDNNTLQFSSPGINATTAVTGGDGGIPHIDQVDGTVQIAAYVGNFYYRSLNGGGFQQISNNNTNAGQFINPSDLDDIGKTLYGGDDGGKYTIVNNLAAAATPARQVVSVSAMSAKEATAVRVDQSATNTVWLGCSYNSTKPQILKLTNANTTSPTVAVNSSIVGSLNNASVSSIEIDPANSSHLLVTLSNFGIVSIWETSNNGTTWTSVEGNLPDMPVFWSLILPANIEPNGPGNGAGGVLIGTDLGVWYTPTLNGGTTTWLPYTNFPNTPVYMLKYRASDRTVIAATHGRGLWTAQLTVATGVSNVVATRDFIRYVSSANGRLTIMPGSLNIRRMHLEVYDTRGSLVHRETRNYQAATLPIDRWAHGAYIVRITGDKGEIFSQQVVR
jgi:hypothetical protein